MALTNYSQLKSAVSDWLNRADIDSQVPDFIALAEARFNRELRVSQMVGRYTNTSSSGYMTMPTDWLETITFMTTGNPPRHLEYLRNADMNHARASQITGDPRYYTIIDDNALIIPAPSGELGFELVYYKKITALSDADTTNWLLTGHPDIYLYASLVAAEPYLKNDERVMTWAALLKQAMDGLAYADERAKRPSGGFNARRRTFG